MPAPKVRALTPDEITALGVGEGAAATPAEMTMLTPQEVERIEPSRPTPMTAEGVASLYPDVLGGVGGIAPGAFGVAGAALGGIAGEGLRQIQDAILGGKGDPLPASQRLKRLARAGLTQGVFEVVGRGAAKGVARLAAKTHAQQAVIATGKKFNLPLRIPDVSESVPTKALSTISRLTLPGRRVIEKSNQQFTDAVTRAGQKTLDALGPPDSPLTAGKKIADVWDVVEEKFYEEAGNLYGTVDTLAADTVVPLKRAFAKAGEIMKKDEDLLKDFPALFSPTSELGRLAQDFLPTASVTGTGGAVKVARPAPTVTFAQAHRIRSELLRRARESGKDDAVAFAKQVSFEVDGAMEQAAKAGPPDLHEAWRGADRFWRGGKRVIQGGVLRKTAQETPEKVIEGLKPGAVSDLKDLKSALLGHAKDQQVFDGFRRQWLAHQLKAPDTDQIMEFAGLEKRMATWGREFTDEMFGDDVGKRVLSNMRELAAVSSRRAATSKTITGGSLFENSELVRMAGAAALGRVAGLPYAIGSYFIPAVTAKILYSKTATKLVTEGIKRVNESRAMGPAVSLIERGIDIALKQHSDVVRRREAAMALEP